MKNSIQSFVLCATALSLSACGGSSLPKLTADQKAEVKDFTRTSAKLSGVIQSKKGNRKPFMGLQSPTVLAAMNLVFPNGAAPPEYKVPTNPSEGNSEKKTPNSDSPAASGAPQEGFEDFSQDKEMVALSNRIEKAFNDGKCGDPDKIKNPPISSSDSFEFNVSGEKCPIFLDMNYKVDQQASKASGSLQLKLLDQQLRKLSDIVEFGVTGSVDGSNQKSVRMEIDANMLSQKKGNVGLGMKADLNVKKNKGVVTFLMKFTTFTAEFKFEGDKDGHTIELNGEKITDQEFQDYMSGLDKKLSKLM